MHIFLWAKEEGLLSPCLHGYYFSKNLEVLEFLKIEGIIGIECGFALKAFLHGELLISCSQATGGPDARRTRREEWSGA
jgi:hypothetical protein